MLTRLYIRNMALIKEAELLLGEDLTVVTGETGAGKSMLMDALALCLGNRADSKLLRKGAKEAFVEATFELVNDQPQLLTLLDDFGIMIEEGELVLRRVLKNDGASRAFANGARITRTQMEELGERLADIHGQHEQQILFKGSRHAEILDRFGHLTSERQAVEKAFSHWKNVFNKLEEVRSKVAAQEREEALLQAYLNELEEVNYNLGEEEKLAEERKRLMAAEHITEKMASALALLEEEEGLTDHLSKLERCLAEISETSDELAIFSQRASGLLSEASELARDLSGASGRYGPDELMLEQVDNRLSALRDLARKHRIEISDLGKLQQQFNTQLEDLSLMQEGLGDLEEKEQQTRTAFEEACRILSKRRKKVGTELIKAVEEKLGTLKLPDMKFKVDFTKLPEMDWNINGAEKVTFLVSPNPGSDFLPLAKVVSGGEASRLMLALKVVFFAQLPSMTLVFDEIDTGVGGAVADAVGDALFDLAQQHQVLAITHQPQVAAKGMEHIKIEKLTDGKTTATIVTKLDDQKRQEELARMLSGKNVTDEARKAAESLLRGVA